MMFGLILAFVHVRVFLLAAIVCFLPIVPASGQQKLGKKQDSERSAESSYSLHLTPLWFIRGLSLPQYEWRKATG